MKKILLFDSHCDTIEKMFNEKLSLNSPKLCLNLNYAKNNLPYIQCLAVFIHDKYNKNNCGIKRAESIIHNFYKEYEKYKNDMFIIKNKKDMENKKLKSKWGVILTIENFGAMGTSIQNIEKMYNYGVRLVSMTWNGNNKLACGAFGKLDTGLTSLGEKFVREIEKRKICIDVSHLSQKSFWDLSKITDSPIIASHSCCYKICNNPRNLTDEQIKEIASKNGVVCINFCNRFLSNKNTVTSLDVIKHIEHVVNLVGVEHVALGSDFDGLDVDELPSDLKNIMNVENLLNQLEKKGFSKVEIKKIMGENMINLLKYFLP